MNTLNINTMKKQIRIVVMAILMMPLVGVAQQDIFEKYSDNENVSFVSIKPKMFQMLAKIDIDVEDEEAKAYLDMVNSITSFNTIATGDAVISGNISKWVASRSTSLEELMEVKDNGVAMTFYVKEGKDADHVSELLMFVNGLEAAASQSGINTGSRALETIVVSLTGDLKLSQISKLTKKMNIPGSDALAKKTNE